MSRPVIFVLIGALAAIAAIILTLTTDTGEEDNGGPTPATETAAPAGPPATKPAQPPVLAEPMGPILPSFDIVRIRPGGDAVIAGRAAPGAEVVILDGGAELGRVIADRRGEWVFVPESPLLPGDRELSLKVTDGNGNELYSSNVVILAVPEAEQPGRKALVVRAAREGGGSTVLQGAGEGSLTIDAVDYGEDRRISLSGRATPGGTVRLYLDNEFLGQTEADEKGNWRLDTEKSLAQDKHTLRADEVNAKAKVLGRIEAEFSPGEPLSVGSESIVVVSPGNSLWRIARRLYGSGFAYTIIFEANKDQIRDPNLIYPGQVFTLPRKK